ncbi:hypothetical protein KP509_16G000700 [Ceratopteris richardii]|uniref:Coiled-coil domain-containing protein n=1 Tax=Ceratopteris richardii TaxID=49495 RepID=A0A8T2SXM5_CERRI|nr:hypothetical protein KP509_16G000700 [Ceratopteris richardii]
MPKKMGVNSKAEEARARKAAAEADKKEREVKEKEDSYWRSAEGAKSRAAKKKEEDAARRAETLQKKAEAKKLLEQEEKELEKYGKHVDKKQGRVSIPTPKVTAAELARQKEEEEAKLKANAEESRKKDRRMADAEEYERMISVENTNRDDTAVDARSVDTALAQMVIASDLPADRHPERRLKAAFKISGSCVLPPYLDLDNLEPHVSALNKEKPLENQFLVR